MIDVSQAYKDTMVAGKRKFNAIVDIILADGTALPTLTNASLRNFSIDDAVSDDNKFTMLGSVIINQFVITINDMIDQYYFYDFYGASVVVKLDCYLLDDSIERIQKGVYFVEDYRYLDGTIELTCYDYMAKFDRSYELSSLEYPATINQIVEDACRICDVERADQTIEFGTSIINNRPSNETTFREVLSWVGQIIGCYAKCDNYGKLKFAWCDIDILNNSYGSIDGGEFDDSIPLYTSGDNADGGLFNPWSIGFVIASASFAIQSEAHNFYYNYSQEVAVADTTITGVTIIVDPPQLLLDAQYNMMLGLSNGDLMYQRTDDAPAMFQLDENDSLIVNTQEGYNFTLDAEGAVICETENSIDMPEEDLEPKTYSEGTEGFVLMIENNGFISEGNVESIISRLYRKLFGMRFRKATTSHMNDPSIESGDIAVLWDRKNRSHPIIVTHTTFKIGAQQRTICGAESGTRNIATRYTDTTKTYLKVSSNLQTEQEIRQRDIENIMSIISAIQESMLNNKRGSGVISSAGTTNVYVQTPNGIGTDYFVTLQKTGYGDLYVSSKTADYFVVTGTANLTFDWEARW